jgi:hypothetical protein
VLLLLVLLRVREMLIFFLLDLEAEGERRSSRDCSSMVLDLVRSISILARLSRGEVLVDDWYCMYNQNDDDFDYD